MVYNNNMAEIKYFNKWDAKNITVEDPGLVNYITVEPIIVPKTGARYGSKKFYKSKITIVERLINKIMTPGHKGKKHKISSNQHTGKAQTATLIVENTLKIIEKKTGKNPIEILVKAIENAAPREEIVTIEYGGAKYPKAVECSPQRRIDFALRQITQGSYQQSFNKKTTTENTLANEIINAYNLSQQSAAISKKLEIERQADSSR